MRKGCYFFFFKKGILLSGFMGEWNMGWLFCLHLICQGWVFYHNFWNFSWIPVIVSNFEVFPHPGVSRIFPGYFIHLNGGIFTPESISGMDTCFSKRGWNSFLSKKRSIKLIFSASFEGFTCCFLQALFLYGVVKNRLGFEEIRLISCKKKC